MSATKFKKAAIASPGAAKRNAQREELLAMLNVWGTKKSEINADEFCVECEREVPSHYDNCPLYKK